MAKCCGCRDRGDETVFGQCRQCHPEPESVHASGLQRELDRLEREDPAVAAAAAGLDQVYEHIKGRLPAPQVAAIYDLEHPYERTLGPDELED